MSTAAQPLFDMSKAQPIFDMSKAQPIGQAPAEQKPGMLDKANEYAAKALSAAGLPTSIENIPEWFQHLTGTHPDSQPFWEPIRKAVKEPTQENIVNAVPFVGPASVAMSKDVQKGDYGGAAATLAGTVAAPLAAGQVRPGLQAAKTQLAEAVRTPTNELTPVTKAVARVGGALVGHKLGVPGAGELAGVFAGPSVADAVLPDRPPVPDFKSGAYSEFEGESGKAVPLTKSPNYSKFLESKKAFLEAKKVQAAQEADAAEAQDLLTRTKKLVAPGEPPTAADLKRAGDLTQVPLQKLQTLAKFGDELAKNEIIRRLKQ